MLQYILFDLDGTLIDTWELYVESYRHALEYFFGSPPSDEDIINLRPASEIRMFRRVAGEDRYRECLERFYSHYDSEHDRLFGGIYPGVREMLRDLKSAGCRTGIVTGKSRRAFEIGMKRCPLGEFDVVVTDDDVTELKPDPEGILKALEATGGSPGEALYVGDSYNDSRAAAAAGMMFGATLWSKSAGEIDGFVERVKGYGPCRIFSAPGDVLRMIG
jgi:HAD superfamily hydrolase (TIGR01549 family)